MENERNLSTTKPNKIRVRGDDLTRINILSYGVGHFMNDLCASCWFFFLSYYLKDIIKIGEFNAGYVMLAGQLADALATPTVGILSDKTNTKIGKRTPWFLGGTALVLVTFSLIFIRLIPEDSSDTVKLIYYCTSAGLFNFGWAAVQVAHMALLPQISLNKKNKDKMNEIRTGFTFLAQTIALCLSFFFFWLIRDKILQYEMLAISCLALGLVTSCFFLFLCREMVLAKNIPVYLEIMKSSLEAHMSKKDSMEGVVVPAQSVRDEQGCCNKKECQDTGNESIQNNNNLDNSSCKEEPITWVYWMKKPDFYVYIFCYMFVRLSINITQSIIPFYMEYMLGFKKTPDGGTRVEISVVLLISTIGSIFNSVLLQPMIVGRIKNQRSNRLVMITVSLIFVAIGCVPMFFLNNEFRYPIYALALFFGIGFSQGLSTVSNLINDVVGSKGAHGAFVYGAYSFADKLSCGLVLVFFLPIANNVTVLKWSMPIFPPVSLMMAFLIVLLRGMYHTRDAKDGFVKMKDNEGNNKKHKLNKKSFIDDSRFTFVTNTNLKLNQTDNNA